MLAYAVSVKDEYRTDTLFRKLENEFNNTAKINFPNKISDFMTDKIPNNLKMNVILEEINLAIKDLSSKSSWNYGSNEIILPVDNYSKSITDGDLIEEANVIAEASITTAINMVVASSLNATHKASGSKGKFSFRETLGEKMYTAILGQDSRK